MGLFNFKKKNKQQEEPVTISNKKNTLYVKDVLDSTFVGKVCMFDGVPIYIMKNSPSGKGTRMWRTLKVKELKSGEEATLTIGWNCNDNPLSYSISYRTNTPRIGSEKYTPPGLDDSYHVYIKKYSNPTFEILDSKFAIGYTKIDSNEDNKPLFTDLNSGQQYTISPTTLQSMNTSYHADKEHNDFIEVVIFENTAYVKKIYKTRIMDAQYLYSEDDNAICMNLETYEMFEISLRYMPANIQDNDFIIVSYAENDDFKSIDPSGKLYTVSIAESKCEENDSDDSNAEVIVTYEGYDAEKKVHILQFVQAGQIEKHECEENHTKFINGPIAKGTPVKLHLSFDDDECAIITEICEA